MTAYQLAKSMADAGASIELILMALKAIEEREAELTAQTARPRSTAALRQQRYREKKKAEETRLVTDGDVTSYAFCDAGSDAIGDADDVTVDESPSLSRPPLSSLASALVV